jgi:methionyl-tRNA formyltransferase
MRLVFIGSKDRGVKCLENLLDHNKNIAAVVSQYDQDIDAFWEGSVVDTAEQRGIEAYTPRNINNEDFVSKLRAIDPDLIIMAGFSQILGTEVLSIPDEGVINLHAGKLPKYRGGSPLNWAMINGETTGTATIHYATEQIDTGSILAEQDFRIGLDDTIADVRERTLEVFPELLVDVVTQIEDGTITEKKNQISDGAYWGSRSPQDGRIDFTRMTAKEVYDRVRALTHPYPGAFVTYDGDRLFVWEAELMNDTVYHEPGRICMKRGEGRVVAAADYGLILNTVQPEGGNELPAARVLDKGGYLK